MKKTHLLYNEYWVCIEIKKFCLKKKQKTRFFIEVYIHMFTCIKRNWKLVPEYWVALEGRTCWRFSKYTRAPCPGFRNSMEKWSGDLKPKAALFYWSGSKWSLSWHNCFHTELGSRFTAQNLTNCIGSVNLNQN